MEEAVNVAVVRGEDRRGAVAQALALIAEDLRACVAPSITILPRPSGRELPLAEAFSATLDALFHAGAQQAVVVGAAKSLDRAGYRREAFGRPVSYIDPRDARALAAPCLVTLIRADRGGQWHRAQASFVDFGRAVHQPMLSVVDAFDVQHTVIAGTDAVAVGVLAAASLGLGGPATSPWHIRVLGDPVLLPALHRGAHPHHAPHFGAALRHKAAV
jgi:hypothetical protein